MGDISPHAMRPFLDAGCGVHETRAGQSCWWCPRILRELRKEAEIRVLARKYTRPAGQRKPGANPNFRGRRKASL
jgi:hypothetical protein